MKNKDLVGIRFSRLVVIEFSHSTPRGNSNKNMYYWLCRCDCGNIKSINAGHLRVGKIHSCGCLRSEKAKRNQTYIESGSVFGRLKYLSDTEERTKSRRVISTCLCSCGKEVKIVKNDLLTGHTKSCGCYKLSVISTKNGLSKTRAYISHKQQIRRELSINLDKWTQDMSKLLFELQKECVICLSSKRLGVDHVNPLSKGFGLEPGNAVVLCGSCNSSKGSRYLSDLPIEKRDKIVSAAEHFKQVWEKTPH